MRKFFATGLLLLAASAWAQSGLPVMGSTWQGAGAASPTVLQTATCNGTTTCNATFSGSTGAGHYLLVYVGSNGNSTGIGVTMTGETFTRQTGTTGCSNNTGFEGDCWTVLNSVGGQTVVTCTASTGSSMVCGAAEITSPSAGHAKDAGGNAHSATTAMSISTSASTTNAGDICIGIGLSPSGGSGFTALNWTSVINANLTNANLLFESTLPGATGVQTATATANSGTNIAEGVICFTP